MPCDEVQVLVKHTSLPLMSSGYLRRRSTADDAAGRQALFWKRSGSPLVLPTLAPLVPQIVVLGLGQLHFLVANDVARVQVRSEQVEDEGDRRERRQLHVSQVRQERVEVGEDVYDVHQDYGCRDVERQV